MSPARVAVFADATPLHVECIRRAGSITVVPMPLRDRPEAIRAFMDAARGGHVVADEAHAGLARQCTDLPVIRAAPSPSCPTATCCGPFSPTILAPGLNRRVVSGSTMPR